MSSRDGLEVVPAQAHNLNDASASLAPATTSPKWGDSHPEFLKRENATANLLGLLSRLDVINHDGWDGNDIILDWSRNRIIKYVRRRVKSPQ